MYGNNIQKGKKQIVTLQEHQFMIEFSCKEGKGAVMSENDNKCGKLCLENIRYLAKEKNMKIGDLERNANVSVGYLSRLNSESDSLDLKVSFLKSISEQLGVPMDIIANCELDSLSETDMLVQSFLKSLIEETARGASSWEKMKFGRFCSDNRYESFLEEDDFGPQFYSFFLERCAPLSSDIFSLKQKGGKGEFIFVTVCVDSRDNTQFELYALKNGGVGKVVCSNSDMFKPLFVELLNELNVAITLHSKEARIDDATRSIIEDFMSGIIGPDSQGDK